MAVYAIITDDGLDQIVETLALAKREKRDLERMGLDHVKIKEFEDEEAAYTWADTRR